MATAQKDLTNANDEIRVDVPNDHGYIAGIQYGTGGLGTIVLEGRINNGNDWFAIGITPAAGGAVVASLAAAGAGSADVSFCEEVRIRKSVAGAGPVTAGLQLSKR